MLKLYLYGYLNGIEDRGFPGRHVPVSAP